MTSPSPSSGIFPAFRRPTPTAPRQARQARQTITVTLTDAGTPQDAPPHKRLARLLKMAKRGYGWRCVAVMETRERMADGGGER